MKIEEGKFYRTRDGQKIGPATWVEQRDWSERGYFSFPQISSLWANGYRYGPNTPSDDDAVGEWLDSPVRTVTRKEIVPGGYDGVRVDIYDDTRVRIGMQHTIMDAGYLRAAADVFTQLADALEDQK